MIRTLNTNPAVALFQPSINKFPLCKLVIARPIHVDEDGMRSALFCEI